MDDPICHDVQEDHPACKLSRNNVKDMLRLVRFQDLDANSDSQCSAGQAEERQNV